VGGAFGGTPGSGVHVRSAHGGAHGETFATGAPDDASRLARHNSPTLACDLRNFAALEQLPSIRHVSFG
jgi:hypothetical protein